MKPETMNRRTLFLKGLELGIGASVLAAMLEGCDPQANPVQHQQNATEYATAQAAAAKELAAKQYSLNMMIQNQAETLATVIDRRMQADRKAGKKVTTPINKIAPATLVAEAPTRFPEAPDGAYSFQVTGRYDTHGKLVPGSVTQVIINEDVIIQTSAHEGMLVPYYAISYDLFPSGNWRVSDGLTPGLNGQPLPEILDTAYPDMVSAERVNAVYQRAVAIEHNALTSPPVPLVLPAPIVSGTGK